MSKTPSEIFHNLPIRTRLTSLFISIAVVIAVADFIVFMSIDRKMTTIDDVYASNTENTELLAAIDDVESNLTSYMLTKSTDVMEEYFRAVYSLENMLSEMDTSIQGGDLAPMKDDIKNMTESYLSLADETIQNKRGRDVEKYRTSYEEASKMYGYIKDYINSLNAEQFKENTTAYNTLRASMRKLEGISFLVLGIIIVAGVAFIYMMTNQITKPLTELSVKAKEVAEGNFDVKFTESPWNDETKVLSDALSEMLISIKSYMESEKKNLETERDLREKELTMEAEIKEAQLRYFQAQIDPHFLFNTLNAGAQLAMLEGADRTSQFIENVAEFFRYNIRKDGGVTTIRDEIKLADYYIAILNVRFGGEIETVKEVDDSLLDAKMPKMILQPLIENSVNHGIRGLERKGIITIKVCGNGDHTDVSISDNGVGMTGEEIKAALKGDLHRADSTGHFGGVGLPNVSSRLELFFKRSGVMEVESDGPDKGTTVTLHIPNGD